jgi:hypothetical protein
MICTKLFNASCYRWFLPFTLVSIPPCAGFTHSSTSSTRRLSDQPADAACPLHFVPHMRYGRTTVGSGAMVTPLACRCHARQAHSNGGWLGGYEYVVCPCSISIPPLFPHDSVHQLWLDSDPAGRGTGRSD